MHDIEESVQVGVEHLVPRFIAHAGEGHVGAYACVRDDAVVDAVFFDVFFEDFFALFAVANVELQRADATSGGLNFFDESVNSCLAAVVVRDHSVAGFGHGESNGAAYASACSCNENLFLVVHFVPFVFLNFQVPLWGRQFQSC